MYQKKFKIGLASSIAMALVLSACGGGSESTLDANLSSSIKAAGITGDPTTGLTLPSITSVKAQLGMKLFFTKGLGGDKDSACVTCHHPKLGGGDDLSLPIGSQSVTPDWLGPGRLHSPTAVLATATAGGKFDGGPTVPRNAPTTFNIGLWKKVLFHDGRVEALTAGGISTPDSGFNAIDANAGPNLAAAQSRFPITSPEEMRGFQFAPGTNDTLRAALVTRFTATPGSGTNTLANNNWLAEFRLGFASTANAATLITEQNIAEAIGEYENSQVFINNSWKAYVDGNKIAISDDAKNGALLFFKSVANGGANCASCHSGNFYTDEGFHVVAMPQIGRGKGDGPNGTDDFGRIRVTTVAADKYAFRTPTLLNVEETGPWGHAGSYTSLKAVVKHHLNPQQAINDYDYNQLDASVQAADMAANTQLAMDTLAANRTAGVISPILKDVSLSDTQVNQIVAFLKTLTDPCVQTNSCIGAWIPTAEDANPDGLRVHAVGPSGLPL
ncbi:MAG: cytochrome c peroxidase [Woeseiaceae bacterium]